MDTDELTSVWEREVTEEDMLTPVSGLPSGRETPVSVESLALEWDHTVDVGGSSSPEDEDEVTYYSALSGTGHVKSAYAAKILFKVQKIISPLPFLSD